MKLKTRWLLTLLLILSLPGCTTGFWERGTLFNSSQQAQGPDPVVVPETIAEVDIISEIVPLDLREEYKRFTDRKSGDIERTRVVIRVLIENLNSTVGQDIEKIYQLADALELHNEVRNALARDFQDPMIYSDQKVNRYYLYLDGDPEIGLAAISALAGENRRELVNYLTTLDFEDYLVQQKIFAVAKDLNHQMNRDESVKELLMRKVNFTGNKREMIRIRHVVSRKFPDANIPSLVEAEQAMENNGEVIRPLEDNEKLAVAYHLFYQKYGSETGLAKIHRNRVQGRLLQASEQRCGQHIEFIRQWDAETNFTFGALTTALAGAGAIVTGVTPARILSGTAAIFSGMRDEWRQAFFANMATHVIIPGIRSVRGELLQKMIGKREQALVNYTLEDAVQEALLYHAHCNIISGITHAGESITLVDNPGIKGFKSTLVEAKDMARILKEVVDSTAPVLKTAAVNGTSLVLTYDETLNRTTPATTAFTIDNSAGGGGGQTVSAVGVSGTTVTLTLNPGVAAGNAPTVTYVVPTINPIEDKSGNKAVKLDKHAVTNSTKGTTALTVTGITDPIAAGTASDVIVTAVDSAGTTDATYVGTVTFSSSDGAATFPVDYTFVPADLGVHTFDDGVTMNTAGEQTITAADTVTGTIIGTQKDITVQAGGGLATALTVTGITDPITAGTASDVIVTAVDSAGTTDATYVGTVTFSSSDGAATFPVDYTFVPADLGVHTFDDGVTMNTAGEQTITAADTVTGTIIGTQKDITVQAGGGLATALTVTGITDPITAGTASDVIVTAVDSAGTTDATYVGTVTFSSSDGAATFPVDYTFVPADLGVHTFDDGVTMNTAGEQTITAADTVTGTITGMQNAITVQ